MNRGDDARAQNCLSNPLAHWVQTSDKLRPLQKTSLDFVRVRTSEAEAVLREIQAEPASLDADATDLLMRRGLVIEALIRTGRIDDAVAQASEIRAADFSRFKAVVSVLVRTGDGPRLEALYLSLTNDEERCDVVTQVVAELAALQLEAEGRPKP